MQDSEHSGHVLTCANLREYFHDALQSALAHQHLAVEDQTEHYVVNLLTLFSRSEQLFEQTPDGVRNPVRASLIIWHVFGISSQTQGGQAFFCLPTDCVNSTWFAVSRDYFTV